MFRLMGSFITHAIAAAVFGMEVNSFDDLNDPIVTHAKDFFNVDFANSAMMIQGTYSDIPNNCTPTIINFRSFFVGIQSY